MQLFCSAAVFPAALPPAALSATGDSLTYFCLLTKSAGSNYFLKEKAPHRRFFIRIRSYRAVQAGLFLHTKLFAASPPKTAKPSTQARLRFQGGIQRRGLTQRHFPFIGQESHPHPHPQALLPFLRLQIIPAKTAQTTPRSISPTTRVPRFCISHVHIAGPPIRHLLSF